MPVCANLLQSCATLSTLWTVALQAPLSMGFSRQEYWSGLPFPSPGNLPDPGMEPVSLMFPAVAVVVKNPPDLLSKSLQAIDAGEGVEEREPSYTAGGNAN